MQLWSTLNFKLCVYIPIQKGTCKNYIHYLCTGNMAVMTISQRLLTSHTPCSLLLFASNLSFSVYIVLACKPNKFNTHTIVLNRE
jgi:hypothetical protein